MADNELLFLKASSKARAVLQTGSAVTVTFEPYQYTQLETNQVRVMNIAVEPLTGFLVCHFDVRDLASSQGAYIAISYCWGDPKPAHRVLCSNGQSLLVTESAAEIMKFVIPRNPTDFFWIDQLCINQADPVEKAAQVSVMGQIYSLTKQVVAWMGRGDRSSKRAIAFVRMLSGQIEDLEREGLQPTRASLKSLPGRVRNDVPQLKASRKWSALSHLLGNPWFERVWVMQEVIMACAKTSHTASGESHILLSFEKCSIDFDGLAKVLEVIENCDLDSELCYYRQNKDRSIERGITPRGLEAIKTFSTSREFKSRGIPILFNFVLSHAWHFKASNDRDKLYAVMAFADEIPDASLRPNYESTVEDVYTAWATALLKRDDNYPLLLHMSGIGLQRSLLALPSWVPDFSSASPEVLRGFTLKRSVLGGRYLASGTNEKTEIGFDLLSPTLRFQGIQIDAVSVVWRPPSSGMRYPWYHNLNSPRSSIPARAYYRSLLQWMDDIESFLETPSPDLRPDKSLPRDILWQTMIGEYPSSEAPIDSSFSQAFKCWYHSQRVMAGKNDFRLIPARQRQPDFYDQAQKFENLISESSKDRSVFGITQKRLVGHGPEGLLLGDIVCIVKGASTPFLLRPDKDNMKSDRLGSKRWRLVGSCFVHGLMYGEGLRMGELEEFVIV